MNTSNSTAPTEKDISDMTPLHLMFQVAVANGVKRPKMLIDTHLTLSLAPATGRNKGYIYIKQSVTNGLSGRESVYRGKIHSDGRVFLVEPDNVAPMTKLMILELTDKCKKACNAPESTAKIYGQRFGKCSICARELTNQLSIDSGIGPICADKMGISQIARAAPIIEARDKSLLESVLLHDDTPERLHGLSSYISPLDALNIIPTTSSLQFNADELQLMFSMVDRYTGTYNINDREVLLCKLIAAREDLAHS